jgi:hypothetical protein
MEFEKKVLDFYLNDACKVLGIKNIFNTERGVDLFNNESTFINDFRSKCATFWTDASNNIAIIDKNNGTIYDGIDVNDKKYLTNSTSRNPEVNLTRELMKQIASIYVGFPSMVLDNNTGLYKVPFVIEDKISFILTIRSDPTQTSITGNNPGSSIPDRSYKILLNVV